MAAGGVNNIMKMSAYNGVSVMVGIGGGGWRKERFAHAATSSNVCLRERALAPLPSRISAIGLLCRIYSRHQRAISCRASACARQHRIC
jgi:hypothetical protein